MRRVLPWLGLAALAAVAVFLVAALVRGPGEQDEAIDVPIPADPTLPIQTTAALNPRTVTFGDTVQARVDVTLDRERVDPDSVRIATDFGPWVALGEPERLRRDGESTTHLRSTWTLRCLASACLPPAQPLNLPFTPATVTYDTIGEEPGPGEGGPIEAAFPALVVQTRLDAQTSGPSAAGSGTSPFETPWRADMVSMPPVSFRIDPEIGRVPLFAAAAGFALLGLVLAFLGRPRRRPVEVVAPEEPPAPVLTPLEQALALLQDGSSPDGAADRRRALELVAAELAGRGDEELAEIARALAWSRQAPAVERTTPLAEQARPVLGLDEEEPVPEAEEVRDA